MQATIASENEEALLTPAEVAKIFKVTAAAVYQMKQRGKLPFVTIGERGVRFKRADIEAYIQGRRTEAD